MVNTQENTPTSRNSISSILEAPCLPLLDHNSSLVYLGNHYLDFYDNYFPDFLCNFTTYVCISKLYSI